MAKPKARKATKKAPAKRSKAAPKKTKRPGAKRTARAAKPGMMGVNHRKRGAAMRPRPTGSTDPVRATVCSGDDLEPSADFAKRENISEEAKDEALADELDGVTDTSHLVGPDAATPIYNEPEHGDEQGYVKSIDDVHATTQAVSDDDDSASNDGGLP